MNPVTAPPNYQLPTSQFTAFMKAETKTLGTVQIMIGIWTFLLGIVLSTDYLSPLVLSGITLWGSLLFISSGALSVAAANNSYSCVVKSALGLNVASAVVAGFAIILLVADMIFVYSDTRHLRNGINGVLLIFSLLELIISICTSVFACKATCYTETTVMYSHPMYSQPMYPQPMCPQLMNAQQINVQPINPQVMNPQPMNTQPMYPQSMNPQPMYNPTFYNSQDPQQSSVVTCNKV
ncbi:membrane-spanning 4-domains subfamily A member 8-like [Clarias gariepinus]|uniref:membrane-spanning 4-domains subfamily A member 8-like n=1 Tax=Clarias gariepinus TaxID=13013 RepID=UPI00234C27FE|nr:membrane-spanning 4-domains subfamily A member 8-like [Clarias gariepinus]